MRKKPTGATHADTCAESLVYTKGKKVNGFVDHCWLGSSPGWPKALQGVSGGGVQPSRAPGKGLIDGHFRSLRETAGPG